MVAITGAKKIKIYSSSQLLAARSHVNVYTFRVHICKIKQQVHSVVVYIMNTEHVTLADYVEMLHLDSGCWLPCMLAVIMRLHIVQHSWIGDSQHLDAAICTMQMQSVSCMWFGCVSRKMTFVWNWKYCKMSRCCLAFSLVIKCTMKTHSRC